MSSYKTRARDKGNINNDYTKAVISGTSAINAESLTAFNLLPNLPTKTNGSSIITSSLLEISDINGLGSAIDGFVSYNGTLPAPVGNFTKLSDIDGNIENSTITETDILNLQNDKVNKSGDSMTGNLDMTNNALFNVRTITGNGIDSVQILNAGQGLDAFVDRARIQSVNNIELNAGVNSISCESNVDLNNNDITNATTITATGEIFGARIVSTDIVASNEFSRIKTNSLEQLNFGTDILQQGTDFQNNNINNVNILSSTDINCTNTTATGEIFGARIVSTDIVASNEFGRIKINSLEQLNFGTDILQQGTNFQNNSINNVNQVNTTNISGFTAQGDIDVNNNDLLNVNNVETQTLDIAGTTQYISNANQLPAPVGNYYVIPNNTTWIICGQITLEYGIEYGINCSLRGIDFSAQITFDETSRDCDFKAVDNNFYLSQITIVNGGGRFTGNTTLVRGLLNAQNYNVGAPPPFYARNKRFKITDVNILRPFKIGTVEGFGTLNITNNFFNGGGGLTGQPTSYYTNEGISISDGLSLEFNNNKLVLMLGAQQVSTLKLLNMKSRVSSLLGFNATTLTGNIFHPRNSETGIDFDADSRTELGNISGNVFIRTGGASPLINYTDQPTYDNYNPLSIENYSINSNTGVVDSEPNLKCGITESQSISSATATLLEPFDNADVKAIDVSARFGIQLDLTGVSSAFVINERITDTASGNSGLILAVDTEAGGLQSVYITDMSGDFSSTPTTFTSATGNATGGTLRWIFRYCEKDPRKLVLSATFSVSVGNNKEYFIAPSMMGVADTICESGGVSTNTGAGSTLTIVCSKKYSDGDKEQFFFRTTDASAGNVQKGIIVIK